MAAVTTGDMEGLLAPDVTGTADSGGEVIAVRRLVVGAEKVVALLLGIFRADMRIELMEGSRAHRRIQGVF